MNLYLYRLAIKSVSVGWFAAIFLAGCASIDGEPVKPIGAAQLGGLYTVVAATDSTGPVELGEPPTVTIESEFATLKIDAGCNDHFGSFTLTEDGSASFTIAGQTNQTCDASTEDSDRRLIAAFEELDAWTQTGKTVELTGSGTTIRLES